MRRTNRAAYEAALKSGKKDLFDITSGKEALVALLIAGGAITVLHFAPWLLVAAMPLAKKWDDSPKRRQKFRSAFEYMRRREYIFVEERKGHVHVTLTPKGRLQAQKKYANILAFQPRTHKVWDGKWRLILFDVPTADRIKRNAFRSLIRRLGATMLQKSVWIYPHDCSGEIDLLKEFFKLGDAQVRLVVSDSLGDDTEFRKYFRLPKQ